MVTGPFDPRSLELVQRALDYWTARGATFIDLPWVASEHSLQATCPAGAPLGVEVPGGWLVNSGEQSFLELWAGDGLAEGDCYIGWTPCFRREPRFDRLHSLGFLKAELFLPLADPDPVAARRRLRALLDTQGRLFDELALHLGRSDGRLTLDPEDERQVDIQLNGIEGGSYGVRAFDGRAYLYGTALALPRFTQALAAGVSPDRR